MEAEKVSNIKYDNLDLTPNSLELTPYNLDLTPNNLDLTANIRVASRSVKSPLDVGRITIPIPPNIFGFPRNDNPGLLNVWLS